MFTVSDLVLFTSIESITYKLLKPWWDHAISLLLFGHFLLTMVVWFILSSRESGGIVCVPLYINPSLLDTSLARYVISQCQRHLKAWRLLYYPVCVLLEWFILYIIHSLWVILPTVYSKIESISQIFNEINSIELIFKKKFKLDASILPDICFKEEDNKKFSIIYDKIVLILMGSSLITKSYFVKIIFLFILCSTFLALNFYFLYFPLLNVDFHPATDFVCPLEDPTFSRTLDYGCTVSSMLYIYLVGIVHLFLYLLIFGFNIWSIYWFLNVQNKFFDANDFYSLKNDHLMGLPGYNDFRFYVCLMSYSLKDGGITFESLRKVLMTGINAIGTIQGNTEDKNTEEHEIGPNDFDEEFSLFNELCSYLGLKLCYKSTNNTLLECIEYFHSKTTSIDLRIVLSIEERLLKEIHSDILYYKELYENTCKNQIILAKLRLDPGVPTYFFVFLNSLSNNKIEQCSYEFLLQVTANMLNISIYLLKLKNDQNKINFISRNKELSEKSLYLGHLNNNIFVPLKTLNDDKNSKIKKFYQEIRYNYWNDIELRLEFQKIAVHKISRNFDSLNINSDSHGNEATYVNDNFLAKNYRTVRNKLFQKT